MLETVRVPAKFAPLFEQAQDYVSRYFSSLKSDPKQARIEVAGQRYVLVRAGAVSVEFFEMVERLYTNDERPEALDVARRLLFDIAHAMGMADARAFSERMQVTEPIAKLSAGPVHFAYAGWAFVDIAESSSPTPDEHCYVLFDHPYSFECDAWLEAGKRTDTSVCIMNAGYSSGWGEQSFGVKLVAVEILCRAKGDEACRFIMAPPHRVEAHIERYKREHPHLASRVQGHAIPGFFSPRSDEQLLRHNRQLEQRVTERNRALEQANQLLRDDIAERRKAEAALSAAQELNERLIEALPGGVVHVHKDGSILRANAEAQRILGLSHEELSNRYTADFDTLTVFEDGSPASVEDFPVTKALLTGEAQPGLTLGTRRPDGTTSWAVYRAVPVKASDGSTSGAVVTFLDITERKLEEDQRQRLEFKLRDAQKLESLGILAGGIAHDFNNLLATILGNASFAKSKLRDHPEVCALLEEVELGAQRAAELTKQMLAYSGRRKLAIESLELPSAIREIANLLKASIAKTAELHYHFQDHIAPIQADATQVRQVIMNLITNAAEAIGDAPGQVDVTVRQLDIAAGETEGFVGTEPIPGNYVSLLVADTGSGMDAKTRAKMFDPFFSTKAAGRGLGLASVLGIMRGHQGAVRIHSVPGEGTQMEVLFPVSRPKNVSPPAPSKGTVLVVDDDHSVRLIATRALTDAGYHVLTAENGREAVRLVESRADELNLIIMDLTMPKMGGVEALDWIRDSGSRVPIVLSSGYSEDVASLESTMFEDFLEKPYTVTKLLDLVTRHIAQAKP